ncbi:MAG TPA: Calx-beta domain-containing protein [archaeon]|nr:Calx-beta domain-containing protein [archaeon]
MENKSRKPVALFAAIIFLALFIQAAEAANFYVSKSGNNSNGLSWTSAWNEMNQINWANINPGDIIYLDGGPSGVSYFTTLNPTKGGTINNRITITRSTEAGRSGKVQLSSVAINQPFITIDGKNRNFFEISSTNINAYVVNINITSNKNDDIELKNIYFTGTPSTGWGIPIIVYAGSLVVENSEFNGHNGAEDYIKFTSTGNLRVERSVFHPWRDVFIPESNEFSHSDMIQGCWEPRCFNMGDFIFRYNIANDGPYNLDGFIFHNNNFQNVEITHNVFMNMNSVLKIGSAQSLTMANNVYKNTVELICYGSCPLKLENNIYVGTNTRGGEINNPWIPSQTPTHSIWDSTLNSPGFVAATGNSNADPKFLNPNSLFGADGIPHTQDDGFNIVDPLSPAINAGTAIGGLVDILGNSIAGTADIGAYEFSGSAPPSTTYVLSVSKSGTGSGMVSATGINCGSDCSEAFNSGISLTLTAQPSSGSSFAGWSGACSGSGNCTILMDGVKSVTATFNVNPFVLPGLSWEAEAGTIAAPFSINSGLVSQSSDTGSGGSVSLGGKASYRFNITQAGEYAIKAFVDAPNTAADSFFINIDAEPTSPSMVWDILPGTNGVEERTVGWRGNGAFDNPQFQTKLFTLTPGEHELIIRGREANVKIDRITIEKDNPPIRSNGAPTGILAQGTSIATLTLTTNENATCKYSTNPSTPYDSMIGSFQTQNTTTHARDLSALSNGQSYTYYIKCRDSLGNTNTDDFTISFSIAASPLTTVTIAPPNSTVTEGATSTLTFSHNGSTQNALTVNYVISGTATNGADYQQIPAAITIPSGANNTTLQIRTTDDQAVEGTETITLTLTTSVLYTTNQQNSATISITDNDTLNTSTTFEAESGAITAPFNVSTNYISQPVEITNPTQAGRASYQFTINEQADYIINAVVNAPTTSADSFFVNIDSEPTDPAMVWDIIPLTIGMQERKVGWRGVGTFDNPQFKTKVFNLSTGQHQLIIRGREANAQIDRITIQKYIPPKCLNPLNTISSSLINIYNCPLPRAIEFDIKPDFANLDLNNQNSLEIGISTLGKISYANQNLKLVRETANEQDSLDLDSAIEITQSKIYLNSVLLPELNKPATLTLYNINANNPKILKDGSSCPQCLITSYSKNTQTINFTVPGFSTYEIIEDSDDGSGDSDGDNQGGGDYPTDGGSGDYGTNSGSTGNAGSGGGGGGTGSEGYKATTRNLEITPLTLNAPANISTIVSHAIPTPQNFTLQLKITKNNQTTHIDTATISNLQSGKAQKITFPNTWTPTQTGDYNATILLYKDTTLYDKQTKKITIGIAKQTETNPDLNAPNVQVQDQNKPQKLWDYNLNPQKDTNASTKGQPLDAAQIGIILIILVALATATQGIILIKKGQ